MKGIAFTIDGAVPDRAALAPTLAFDLGIEAEGRSIVGLTLTCQIRVEPNRRDHAPNEVARLVELFGEPARWGRTLRPFVWATATAIVGPFEGATRVPLLVPCTYDLEVSAAKYFAALDGGDIPLVFLFSGTVFAEDTRGTLSVERVSWDSEVRFALPSKTWRELIDGHWPDAGWLRLDRTTLQALMQWKAERAIPTWDRAIEALLEAARDGRDACDEARS